jgi:ABC-type amino acid transport substrate-binding protein
VKWGDADTIGVARDAAAGTHRTEAGAIRTRRTVIAVLAFCALLMPDIGARADDQLRVILDGVYPPFTYQSPNGALIGFDVDIASALCTVLVVRCVFTDLPFQEMIPALVVGRGDAIIASLSITAERKQLVAFTNRYYRTPMQFVARKGFDRPITPDGLRGLRIGVGADTTNERYARQSFGDRAEIVPVPGDEDDINRTLIDGKVDLLLGDTLGMWRFTTSTDGSGFAFIGKPIYVDEDIGIAVRKEDDALRQRLNAALARIRLDGTYQKINAKYFPFSIY